MSDRFLQGHRVVGVGAGYAGWAASYDDPGNDTIALEQPAVRALLDELPPGPVLDAACGTGRHTAYLLAAGREVVGIDASEAMLARARAKLPGADLRHGELAALPFDDGAFAGAVCALALSHLADIAPAIAELGRILRPGGRLVISDPHPFATGVLGRRAGFTDETGARVVIPVYPHLHGAYVAAFAAAGLVARRLIEPVLSREQARTRPRLRTRRRLRAGAHRRAGRDRVGGRAPLTLLRAPLMNRRRASSR